MKLLTNGSNSGLSACIFLKLLSLNSAFCNKRQYACSLDVISRTIPISALHRTHIVAFVCTIYQNL